MTEMSNRKRASNDQLPTILRLVPIRSELAPKIYQRQDSVHFGVVNCECGGIVRNYIFPDTLP